MESRDLSIGDVVEATGLGEATLRAWERRYGFPEPRRTQSGHRRYGQEDVERLLRVVEERDRGTALAVAIERSRGASTEIPSLFARLRAQRPDLLPMRARKREMIHLSHAIEDESASHAERGILIGSFQRERFYRQAEPRWNELARGCEVAFAFADFKRLRRPRGAAAELPVDRSHPIAREWGLICLAPGHAAAMVAWEPPAVAPPRDGAREFEVLLSVDPAVVREAAEAAASIAAPVDAKIAATLRARLADEPSPRSDSQLRLATAITARLLEAMR